MLNSVEMFLHGSNRLAGIVLVVGTGIVAATAVSGEERPHPSLVDPGDTKCAVCHKDVASTHSASASQQACLSCHSLEKRGKKTILIVPDTPRSSDPVEVPAAEENVVGDPEDSPAVAATTVTRSDAQPVEPVDEIQPVRPEPAVVAVSEAGSPENRASPVSEGGAASAGHLYAEGMAAFTASDFDRAFQIWRSMLADKLDHYVVQVEVDTYLQTAQSTVAAYGDNSLYVLKKDDLYWVFSGFFATRAQAADALKSLPEALRRGGAFPISVRQILPPQ